MRPTLLALLLLLASACGSAPEPSTQPARPPAKATLIAALGDSITQGSPLWEPESREGDEQSQFEYWAQRRLGPRVAFRNCGVFGERTDEIAGRLEECARGARVLIVQGGINDIAQGRPIAEAADDLRAMVRAGKDRGLKVLLTDVLPWNNGFPDAVEPIEALNERIAAIGREEGVEVLPFAAALEDPDRPGRMRADLTDDGDHPSVLGYRALAELIPAP